AIGRHDLFPRKTIVLGPCVLHWVFKTVSVVGVLNALWHPLVDPVNYSLPDLFIWKPGGITQCLRVPNAVGIHRPPVRVELEIALRTLNNSTKGPKVLMAVGARTTAGVGTRSR